MKIDISKKELQKIRDIVWEGRQVYRNQFIKKETATEYLNPKTIKAGTKLLKKLNAALEKVHGHTCNGDIYL